MISRTIDYVDYNGNERSDTFYFHLSRAELWRLQIGENGEFSRKIQALIDEKNQAEIWKMFEELVRMAVGKKSIDGKRFDKSDDAKADFLESEAYSEFIEMLMTGDHGKNANYASDFVNGLITTSERTPAQNDQNKPGIQLVN